MIILIRIPTGALRPVVVTAMHATLSRMVSSTTVSATMWIGIPAGGALRVSLILIWLHFLCYHLERCMMNIFLVVMLKIPTDKNSLI